MFLRNQLILSSALSMILILGACGATDSNDANPNNNNNDVESEDMSAAEREATIDTPEQLPISDAFEEHSIWISTSDSPERNTSINSIFVFEDEEVTNYGVSDLTIEEFNDLSDDEVIQYVDEHSSYIMSGQYTLDIKWIA